MRSSDNVGVTGYEIFTNGSLFSTVSNTTATVSGLSAGTTYAFTVKAKDAAGNRSAASTSRTVTTQSGTPEEAVMRCLFQNMLKALLITKR